MSARAQRGAMRSSLLRAVGLVLLCAVSLQLYFLLRIVLMGVVDPQSTTFQRSEAWRLLREQQRIRWSQQWVDDSRLSPQLKRAVIASEDAGFTDHGGVDWEAIEKAWGRNQRSQTQADRRIAAHPKATSRPPKLIGGSTISQQLAKNLFLSGERSLPRKAQELVLTLALETLLSKQRLLEIYLNSVEWGEGLFGAQAASRHYFHVDADRLDAFSAARLAVMLPAPKRFEKSPGSAYVMARAATIAARMPAVDLP